MNQESNELVAAIGLAVVRNDDDTADSLLTDLTLACLAGRQSFDDVVAPVLTILARATDPENDCSFFVVLWLERVYGELGEAGKSQVRQFVADHYGEFSGIVAMEMADFVGGFRDDWAIRVVADWIAASGGFTVDAAECIDTAIRELADDDAAPRDETYRENVRDLAKRFEKTRA
jgi:hypothetical protein